MIPATVLLGSMAAGGLGLYLSGSTGAPSTGIAKTVEDSVTSIADQVSAVKDKVVEAVQPDNNPEPVEQPVEQPVEPVEQPVEAVEQPEIENRAVAPSLPEIDSMAGGQRGGFGRPTWAPLNSGTTLFQAIGVEPGSTAGNVLATVTGSKTPQQIQQELVNIDREIRAAATQQFQINEKFNEELEKFNGSAGGSGIRQDYLEIVGQVSYWKFMEKLSSDKLRSFNGIPEPVAAVTTDLQAEFDKEFKKKDEVGPPPKKEFKVWLKDSIENVNKRKKKNFRGEKPPANEAEYADWYKNLKSKTATSTASGSTTRMTEEQYKDELKKEIDASKKKEDYIFRESMKKSEYDESMAKLTELRSKRSEVVNKLKELNDKKKLLLEDLSAYKVPPSFWDKSKQPEAPKSTVPTGEELNKLLIDYKAKQEEIKQKEEAINEELSSKLQPDGTLSVDTMYNTLKEELRLLKVDLKTIIDKIEGRHVDQTKQLKALSELDTFIKQLKDRKVKGVSVFDNPDFRKVFDMLTVMSLDTDAKSFIVNLDKYSNFFVTTKGFSAYNGEVLDKVFYFFNNYETLIKDATTNDYIERFATAFSTKCGTVNRNIQQAKTVLSDSGDTTTDEFKKLDATQRRILEGRSTAWHTFFTDSDTLKAIPKALSSSLFKTELDKLVKLEGIFKRRILDKIDKTKFETVVPTGSTWISWFLNKVPSWPTLWKSDSERVAYLKRLCEELKPVIKQELDSVFQTNKNRLEKKKMLKQRTDENLKRSEEMKRLRKAMDSSVDKTTSRYSKLLEMYNELELKIISEEKEIVKLRGIISELPSQDEHIKELVQIMKNLETDCVKWMPAYYDRARMGSRFQTLFEEFLNSLGTKPIATYDQFKILAANYVISRVGRQSKNDKGEVVKPQGTYTEKEFNELFEREVARLNLLVRYNICKFQKGQRVRIVELSSYGGKPAGSEGIIDQVIQCKAHDSDTENKYTVLFDGDTTATEGVLQSILESVYGPEPPPPAQVQDLVKGDYVQLRAGADVKYPDKICLLENSAGSTRIRVGKIINLIPDVDPKATVQCYNKTAAGAFTRGDSADYFQKDLEIVVKPDGLPKKFGGGYTRRHLLRGMPKRAKTRRTY